MKKLLGFLTLTLFLFTFSAPSQAGWWIFGQGTDEIVTNYIYINQNSFDESDSKLTLFKESLKEGTVRINGKASVRNAKIGAVFVSLDNKASWKKATLSTNGYFEYIFTPEIGEEYDIYIKIVDTLGKTNDINSTYKQVKVIEENINDKITESLNHLIQAYQNEDPAAFMKYVSDDFAAGYGILDFAIRKDFTAFDYIELKPFINNISRDNSGRIYVAIQYIRKVVASKTGSVYSDSGYTEFVFENDEGVFKVFSMKTPLLFGLSDAGEVATGKIQNSSNNPILLVDSSGNVSEKPFRTAITLIENDSAISDIESGQITVVSGNNTIAGYIFFCDPMGGHDMLNAPAGSAVKELAGDPNIDTLTTAAVSAGDADTIWTSAGSIGKSYAIKLGDGKYMLLQHVSGVHVGAVYKYRFQPDGTNNF